MASPSRILCQNFRRCSGKVEFVLAHVTGELRLESEPNIRGCGINDLDKLISIATPYLLFFRSSSHVASFRHRPIKLLQDLLANGMPLDGSTCLVAIGLCNRSLHQCCLLFLICLRVVALQSLALRLVSSRRKGDRKTSKRCCLHTITRGVSPLDPWNSLPLASANSNYT